MEFIIGSSLIFVGGLGLGLTVGIRLMGRGAKNAITAALNPMGNEESDVDN